MNIPKLTIKSIKEDIEEYPEFLPTMWIGTQINYTVIMGVIKLL